MPTLWSVGLHNFSSSLERRVGPNLGHLNLAWPKKSAAKQSVWDCEVVSVFWCFFGKNWTPSLVHAVNLQVQDSLAGRDARVDSAAHLRHVGQTPALLSVGKNLRKVSVVGLLDRISLFLSLGFLPVHAVLHTLSAPAMLTCPADANEAPPFFTPNLVEYGSPGWVFQLSTWREIELVLHRQWWIHFWSSPACSIAATGCPLIHWL